MKLESNVLESASPCYTLLMVLQYETPNVSEKRAAASGLVSASGNVHSLSSSSLLRVYSFAVVRHGGTERWLCEHQ